MTLTISRQTEERIFAQARDRGLTLDQYAAEILESNAPQPVSISNASAEELISGVRELAQTATAVSNYPPDFFSREVIYADHD